MHAFLLTQGFGVCAASRVLLSRPLFLSVIKWTYAAELSLITLELLLEIMVTLVVPLCYPSLTVAFLFIISSD